MLLRTRHHRRAHADPKYGIPLFLVVGAIVLFDYLVKKYAPDMDQKLKNILAVAIAVIILLLSFLLINAGSSE